MAGPVPAQGTEVLKVPRPLGQAVVRAAWDQGGRVCPGAGAGRSPRRLESGERPALQSRGSGAFREGRNRGAGASRLPGALRKGQSTAQRVGRRVDAEPVDHQEGVQALS